MSRRFLTGNEAVDEIFLPQMDLWDIVNNLRGLFANYGLECAFLQLFSVKSSLAVVQLRLFDELLTLLLHFPLLRKGSSATPLLRHLFRLLSNFWLERKHPFLLVLLLLLDLQLPTLLQRFLAISIQVMKCDVDPPDLLHTQAERRLRLD